MDKPWRDPNHEALEAHDGLGLERDRLSGPKGVIEFERPKEILRRRPPPPPAVVADIGGGPGRYSMWLANLGYRVYHRDLLALHVEPLKDSLADWPGTGRRFARGGCLSARSSRPVRGCGAAFGTTVPSTQARSAHPSTPGSQADCETRAPIFAAVSRWTPRLYAILGQKLYETIPETLDELPALEQTGWMRPLFPGSFSAFAHRLGQLRAEIRSVGLQVVSLIGVEGVHYLLSLDDRIGDPLAFRVLLDSARALESVPEILGVSPHLLATTVRPHE